MIALYALKQVRRTFVNTVFQENVDKNDEPKQRSNWHKISTHFSQRQPRQSSFHQLAASLLLKYVYGITIFHIQLKITHTNSLNWRTLWYIILIYHHHTTTVLRPFFRDHPGEPVPEENFWTLRCKGRLTEADTQTIRLGTTPSGLTSAHLYHPPTFLQAGCPSCRPTNSVKALIYQRDNCIL